MTGAFDTHSHIQDPKLIGDFAAVLERAADAGLAGIALCGYDAPSNEQALELARRFSGEEAVHFINGVLDASWREGSLPSST